MSGNKGAESPTPCPAYDTILYDYVIRTKHSVNFGPSAILILPLSVPPSSPSVRIIYCPRRLR